MPNPFFKFRSEFADKNPQFKGKPIELSKAAGKAYRAQKKSGMRGGGDPCEEGETNCSGFSLLEGGRRRGSRKRRKGGMRGGGGEGSEGSEGDMPKEIVPDMPEMPKDMPEMPKDMPDDMGGEKMDMPDDMGEEKMDMPDDMPDEMPDEMKGGRRRRSRKHRKYAKKGGKKSAKKHHKKSKKGGKKSAKRRSKKAGRR